MFGAHPGNVRKGYGRFCSAPCYGRKLGDPPTVCICLRCGKQFLESAARVREGKGKYCSLDCYRAVHVTRSIRTCRNCGRLFTMERSRIDEGKGHFCNLACYKSHCRKQRECTCRHCGRPFLRKGGSQKKSNPNKHQFCSPACRYDHLIGPLHPTYNGGLLCSRGRRTGKEFTGAQKRTIALRDNYSCQVCGDGKAGEYHVDHKIPIWNGGTNEISNGQTLCTICHFEKTAAEATELAEHRRRQRLVAA
jgi:hypothetical protein